MSDVVVTLAALAAMLWLVRVGWGAALGRVTVRFRVPLRNRYPRLWWTAMLVGLMLVAAWARS